MRLILLVAFVWSALAQESPPGYDLLTQAYDAARVGDYDTAVSGFLKAIEGSPQRADLRKDVAYVYLKIGENEAAREQFAEAMRIDPKDAQSALEYAFLCHESGRQAEARRIFNRLRGEGNRTAEAAFRNIDGPLKEGIARWKEALERSPGNFSAHFELARLAEQRDELELAAEQYEAAWRVAQTRRSVLVHLGRVWLAMGRVEDGRAALVAALFGGETRTAENARELLGPRYPYVPEFRRALALDPRSVPLRRELGFLLLTLGRPDEAETEFAVLAESAPDDLLSATQLGFLLQGRGEAAQAKPLLERVLKGNNEDLANRVRAVLHIEQLKTRSAPQPAALDAKDMAERSIRAGYFADAVKYLKIAHEDDPADAAVMLKLGWTSNLLHRDREAYEWFGKARHARDPDIAGEAGKAWESLRPSNEAVRTTMWLYPMYSSRWRDLFGYAQAKVELRTSLGIRTYLSVRLIGDTTGTIGTIQPIYRSESAVVIGAGLVTRAWHGLTGWFEAGSAMEYLRRHIMPDYRGGVSFARGFGQSLGAEAPGWFADVTSDGVFVSRFGNDFLVYSQLRSGYTAGPAAWRTQFHWNGNWTVDAKREDWANYVETGPGLRFAPSWFPRGSYVTVDYFWGQYTGEFRRGFRDFRAGVWYARTR